MSWEHAAEARAALNAIVTDPEHGVAALSSAQTMSNLLKDLLPDAPREKSILVAAAEAGLANTLRQHVDQGMDPNTAIRLTASSFSSTTPFTPDACSWVTGEIATALGMSHSPDAGGLGATPSGFDPIGQQGMPTQIAPIPGSGYTPGQAPTQGFPAVPGQGGASGFGAGGQATTPGPWQPASGQPGAGQPGGFGQGQPPGGGYGGQPGTGYQGQPGGGYQGQPGAGYQGQPGAGFGGQPGQPGGFGGQPGQPGGAWPGAGQPGGFGQGQQAGYAAQPGGGGWQPAGGAFGPTGPILPGGPGGPGGPVKPQGSKRGLLVAGGLVAALIVVVVLAVSLTGGKGGGGGGGGGHKSTPPVSTPPATSPVTTPPVASGPEPLTTIMNPAGLKPVGTQCTAAKTFGLNKATLTNSTFCAHTQRANIVVWGYQFDSASDYQAGLAHINSFVGFDKVTPGSGCPPPSGSAEGKIGWHANKNPKYVSRTGQDIECLTDGNKPVLIWSMPTQNVFFIGQDNVTGTSINTILDWWKILNYG